MTKTKLPPKMAKAIRIHNGGFIIAKQVIGNNTKEITLMRKVKRLIIKKMVISFFLEKKLVSHDILEWINSCAALSSKYLAPPLKKI